KDIRIGDTVVVRKAGMVIPEVFEVVNAKRPKGAKEFDLVAHIGGKCPACGGEIAREKMSGGDADEVAWRCQNVAGCPAQLTRRVEYFAARKALDIESLGGIVAEKLVERGLVKEPLDLFDLKLEPLAALNLGTDDEPRVFGEKNAGKVLEALGRAKSAPLDRWIFALAIPNVGDTIAYQLTQAHGSLGELADSAILRDIRDAGVKENERKEISPRSRKNPPKDEAEKAAREARHEELGRELKEIEERLAASGTKARMVEVGPVAAASVLDYFASPNGRTTLARLKSLGIDPRVELAAPVAAGDSPIAGKTFVLT
ncbi:MAG TPA: DNA ligase (NAD(+)) LigA, partial [Verrucomicrobiales bacterium]|nr:DNA ligase (NAD(+)) LigA [Verrucomicrobiales bacterium]